MANKIKNHTPETIALVKSIATALYAQFISKKMTISKLSKETGLSSNSLKTIFRGETANIASFIAVANAVGLRLEIQDHSAKTPTAPPSASGIKVGDGSPTSTFLR